MAGILDVTQDLAEEFGFEAKFKTTRYGASVEVLADGDVILYVEQSYHEPIITLWCGDEEEEQTYDSSWDFDLAKEAIEEFLERY